MNHQGDFWGCLAVNVRVMRFKYILFIELIGEKYNVNFYHVNGKSNPKNLLGLFIHNNVYDM
jgi:hypothetical protein